ncbi:MAG: penicillin-insensitive murein endopeptidase [Saprospiraceae bacterium]
MHRTFRFKIALVLALLVSMLYFSLPVLRDTLISNPTFSGYAPRFITEMTNFFQQVLTFPLGFVLPSILRHLIVFPLWFLIFYGLGTLYKRYQKPFNYGFGAFFMLLFFIYLFPNSLTVFNTNTPSKSNGQVWNGSLENGKRLPFEGENFTTYGFFGYMLGRTFVHDKVKKTVLDAYKICEETCPEKMFVLGECGWPFGGRFLPHRTHQNGLSVDFMTPLLESGKPIHRHGLKDVWGYKLEFDNKGKAGNLEIDYETTAKHIAAVEKAALENGISIQKIIFDPVLQPFLFETQEGKKLRHLPFTSNRVAIRHDDHYHIDFKLSD